MSRLDNAFTLWLLTGFIGIFILLTLEDDMLRLIWSLSYAIIGLALLCIKIDVLQKALG